MFRRILFLLYILPYSFIKFARKKKSVANLFDFDNLHNSIISLPIPFFNNVGEGLVFPFFTNVMQQYRLYFCKQSVKFGFKIYLDAKTQSTVWTLIIKLSSLFLDFIGNLAVHWRIRCYLFRIIQVTKNVFFHHLSSFWMNVYYY